jgi:uncharacterized Fe-S center protein
LRTKMKADVFFFDYSGGGGVLSGLEKLCTASSVLKGIPGGGSVAVKLHMGELGNISYLRPVFVRRLVDLVKKRGGKPFVTDTVALYPGGRTTERKYLSTAAFNGYVEGSVGAPVVIADGNGDDGVSAPVGDRLEGCDLREVGVASRISEADFLLVLSHVKGHMITGFGGAVKNLAMGCVSREAKKEQHRVNPPLLDSALCDGCEACVRICPAKALTMKEGKPHRDADRCIFCSTCLFACDSGALQWERGNKERFQLYLAHAASAVMQRFRGRIGFINFLQDITPWCDCAAPAGRAMVPDIGILASLDPVAIDRVSLDMIDRTVAIDGSNLPEGPDRMGRLHNVDSLVQLRSAERLGLGSMDYRLLGLTDLAG